MADEMTMVERVARAMREELGLDWPYSGHETLMDTARAAIAAMREPTQAMLDANEGRDPFTWALMIDAALKETA